MPSDFHKTSESQVIPFQLKTSFHLNHQVNRLNRASRDHAFFPFEKRSYENGHARLISESSSVSIDPLALRSAIQSDLVKSQKGIDTAMKPNHLINTDIGHVHEHAGRI